MKKYTISAIVLLLIVSGSYLLFQSEGSFSKDGNLTLRGKPEVIFMNYKDSEGTSLTKELVFGTNSKCSGESMGGQIYTFECIGLKFSPGPGYEGHRIAVEGSEKDGRILVSSLLLVDERPAAGHSIDGLPESSKVPNAPTNFAKVGYITGSAEGGGKEVLNLIYEEPGKPALKALLSFDAESTCAFPDGAQQCIAFSAPLALSLKEKRVAVEGLASETPGEGPRGVLVRLVRVIDDKYDPAYLKAGDLILSWPSAAKLIETCFVKTAFQSHSLDVRLTLKDDRRVRTVEPTIDQLFKSIDASAANCGEVAVATE